MCSAGSAIDLDRVATGVVPLAGSRAATGGQMGTASAPRLNSGLSVPFQQRIDFQRSPGPILTSGDDGGRLGNYADRVVATGYRTSKVVGSTSSTGPTRPWARSTI